MRWLWEGTCNTCDTERFLTARQACVAKCPSGTFVNATSGHCNDCLPGCVLCQDAHRCQRCRTGHTHLYLQGDQCVPECQRGYPKGASASPVPQSVPPAWGTPPTA
ncbi:proprotein convertase subtilisin/kexin type 5-like [Salvelinus sp. IW2-2015]|uniref:proprotein convertase subtilisin/kexin type 5-like n=1 Tax=Salvelinus sp. IW2-2015 TaxID=2691554 RepID=UPI0038D3C91F